MNDGAMMVGFCAGGRWHQREVLNEDIMTSPENTIWIPMLDGTDFDLGAILGGQK